MAARVFVCVCVCSCVGGVLGGGRGGGGKGGREGAHGRPLPGDEDWGDGGPGEVRLTDVWAVRFASFCGRWRGTTSLYILIVRGGPVLRAMASVSSIRASIVNIATAGGVSTKLDQTYYLESIRILTTRTSSMSTDTLRSYWLVAALLAGMYALPRVGPPHTS